MDRFAAMTAFVAVADQRGFARAARTLGLSPPAVTRLVAGLEGELGLALLRRTTRSVSLTDAGARYLERARRILGDLDAAERAARAEREVPSGRFVVAAPAVFGRLEVAPVVTELLERYPALRVELLLADRRVNLVEEGVDAAVRIGPLSDSSLIARRVGETRRVVVGAPRYFERRKRPRTPADLARHTVVEFTAVSGSREWRFHRRGKDSARVLVEPVLVTNGADAAIEHAVRGGGLAMVLSYQVRSELRAGALEVVLARFEPPPLPIHVVYSGARLPSAATRAFIELAVRRKWSFSP
jgi:DNA-binding transcriptional LysR family regulator